MSARLLPLLAGASLLACAPGSRSAAQAEGTGAADTPAPLVALSTGAPVAAPKEASSGIDGDVDVVLRLPAWDALIVGRTAVIVEADFKTVSGYDAKTGARIFRETLLAELDGGRHTLGERHGKITYWAGRKYFTIDPETGAHGPAADVPNNGDCHFVERGAACAFACECSLSVVDCGSLRPIENAFFKKTYVEFFSHDGPPSSGCYGRGTTLVGGNGRTTVVIVEDEKAQSAGGRMGRPLVMLGLDARDASVRWRVPRPEGSSDESAFLPDGKSFYLATSANEVTMFDADTGKKKWASPPEADIYRVKRKYLAFLQKPPGLFRYAEDAAILHDPATGKPRFSVKVPASAFAIPKGVHLDFYDVETNGDPPLDLQILDPERGAVLGTIHVPSGTTVYDDPSGGFYATNQFLIAYDELGKERARADASPPNLHVFTDFVTLFDNERLAALDRRDLGRLFMAEGSLAAQPGSSLAGGILLYRWIDRGKKVGEASLVRVRASAHERNTR